MIRTRGKGKGQMGGFRKGRERDRKSSTEREIRDKKEKEQNKKDKVKERGQKRRDTYQFTKRRQ